MNGYFLIFLLLLTPDECSCKGVVPSSDALGKLDAAGLWRGTESGNSVSVAEAGYGLDFKRA